MISTMKRRKAAGRILAVLLALGLWQLAAMAVNLPVLLPAPHRVLLRLGRLCLEGTTWAVVLRTTVRILAGFLSGLLLGGLAAALALRFPAIETLLWPYVAAMKSVPVASVIILILIWCSAGRLVPLIAFLMAFPILYGNLLAGLRAADPELLEMAELFHIPWTRRLRCLYLPRLRPYLRSGCGMAMGLCWKAGVAAEVIGVVSGSIGEQLYAAKVYFQMADLLAWTVLIVLCSAVLERLTAVLTDHLCRRWSRL